MKLNNLPWGQTILSCLCLTVFVFSAVGQNVWRSVEKTDAQEFQISDNPTSISERHQNGGYFWGKFADSTENLLPAWLAEASHFQFENIGAGQTYVINAAAKSYIFAPQVLVVSENISDLVFAAQ